MAVNKTSLSAGGLLAWVLMNDEDVHGIAKKVFPIVAEAGATLPYITYRRVSIEGLPVKTHQFGPDTTIIEVECLDNQYKRGVMLAELVRNALDGRKIEAPEVSALKIRSCVMSDSEEYVDADAYIQKLVFTIKIQ